MNPPSRGQTDALRTPVLNAPVFFQVKVSSGRSGSHIAAIHILAFEHIRALHLTYICCVRRVNCAASSGRYGDISSELVAGLVFVEISTEERKGPTSDVDLCGATVLQGYGGSIN